MIFFKFNNVGQLISTNKNASENQVSQGSVRANEIFVTFTGLLTSLADTSNYACYLTFIRNDGQTINDLRASATSYTIDGVTYYGYSYLINNKAITAVAGALQISFRLIDLTVSTDNAVERTSAIESVSVVGTTITTSVSINLTEAQIQAIDQAIANAPSVAYQTYVASDSEFEAQINATETTGKEGKIPTIGQVCSKIKNLSDTVSTYSVAIAAKADLTYVNEEFAKYYKKEQVYSKSEVDAQHAELATKEHVDEIDGKIPNNASSNNKLVTLSTLNDAINQLTATKRGTFTSLAELYVAEGNANDYAYYQYEVTEHDTTLYKLDRYIWQNETRVDEDTQIETHWYFDLAINNASFTQAQIDALNSGVTEQKLNGIDTALANRYTKSQVDDLFYKKTQIDTLLTSYVTTSALNTALANYYNKTEVDTKVNAVNTEVNKIKRFDVDTNGNLVSDNLCNATLTFPLNNVSRNLIAENLPSGTYTLSLNLNTPTSGTQYIVYINDTAIGTYYTNESATFTNNGPINSLKIYCNDAGATSAQVMLNKGSTASPYVPYFSADDRYAKLSTRLRRHHITMALTKTGQSSMGVSFDMINKIQTEIDITGFTRMVGVWLGYKNLGSSYYPPVFISPSGDDDNKARITTFGNGSVSEELWTISTMYDTVS